MVEAAPLRSLVGGRTLPALLLTTRTRARDGRRASRGRRGHPAPSRRRTVNAPATGSVSLCRLSRPSAAALFAGTECERALSHLWSVHCFSVRLGSSPAPDQLPGPLRRPKLSPPRASVWASRTST